MCCTSGLKRPSSRRRERACGACVRKNAAPRQGGRNFRACLFGGVYEEGFPCGRDGAARARAGACGAAAPVQYLYARGAVRLRGGHPHPVRLRLCRRRNGQHGAGDRRRGLRRPARRRGIRRRRRHHFLRLRTRRIRHAPHRAGLGGRLYDQRGCEQLAGFVHRPAGRGRGEGDRRPARVRFVHRLCADAARHTCNYRGGCGGLGGDGARRARSRQAQRGG